MICDEISVDVYLPSHITGKKKGEYVLEKNDKAISAMQYKNKSGTMYGAPRLYVVFLSFYSRI